MTLTGDDGVCGDDNVVVVEFVVATTVVLSKSMFVGDDGIWDEDGDDADKIDSVVETELSNEGSNIDEIGTLFICFPSSHSPGRIINWTM